jgi:Protein of unknown function (DUF533)
VGDEIARPVDLQAIVSAVDSPHVAIEAYAASLFAIGADTPAGAAYTPQLAQGLGLYPNLGRELHQSLKAPQLHSPMDLQRGQSQLTLAQIHVTAIPSVARVPSLFTVW